ncbi:hypothetical protein JO972_03880 [Verrucomicrobiaceae bacterium 5K15]|uniref:Uncharacterized protein n=2 Tax=Oceaniferula flava TaxID=2800421 RepID=A0AAE2SCN9_9BACT|nr:hypothetical protein [Oceaniferula flavus]MBM1135386.1 hypothetical protein [Oceaniferula flavus]
MPESQLRHDGGWLFSPKPLQLDKKTAKTMTRLGHPLAQFQQASDSIYQRSAKGKLSSWIHQVLDAGKPEWIIEAQRSAEISQNMPRVIRPDLILTGDKEQSSFALTELDSVPGGMGITLWLSQLYSQHGYDVLGGENGIRDGFQSLLHEGGRVLVSEESGDYQPELEWLAEQCSNITVESAEADSGDDSPAYRFFEWFDWKNIPAAQQLAASPQLTSPCKPHLEEKLWLALLWSPALRGVWEKELRGNHLKRVREIVPFSWVVDPTPLPPQGALPRIDVHSWDEVANFSQTERRLVLKISGFSELAWGSRGVYIGHDMPGNEWAEKIHEAMAAFDSQPRMMQQYHAGQIIEHPYFDPDTGEEKIMQGRARLCPYFFTDQNGKTGFGGCLATIVPADKKKIHGMKDGILVPCMVE